MKSDARGAINYTNVLETRWCGSTSPDRVASAQASNALQAAATSTRAKLSTNTIVQSTRRNASGLIRCAYGLNRIARAADSALPYTKASMSLVTGERNCDDHTHIDRRFKIQTHSRRI